MKRLSRGAARFLRWGAAAVWAAAVAACGSRESQPSATGTPTPTQPPSVVVPKAPVPPLDVDLLTYVRLREPNRLIDRLGNWVSSVQPGMGSEAFRTVLGTLGIATDEFRAGGNAGVFVWNQPTSPSTALAQGATVPIAALLPMAATGQTARGLAERLGRANVVAAGGDTLLVMPGAGELVVPLEAKLRELVHAPLANDIEWYLNIPGLVEWVRMEFGTELDGLIEQLQPLIVAAGGDRATALRELELFGAMIDQLRSLTVALNFPPEALEAMIVAESKPATELEGLLGCGPQPTIDCTGYVDPASMIRAQLNMQDVRWYVDFCLGMAPLLAPANDPAALETLRKEILAFADVGSLTGALGASIDRDVGFRYEGVLIARHPDRLLEFIDRKLALLRSGPLQDVTAPFGVKMVVGERSGRRVGGHDVWSYPVEYKIGPQLGAVLSNGAQAFKPAQFEVARVGDKVVFSLGRPIDDLAKRVAEQRPGRSIDALRDHPAGGWLYVDLNLPAYLAMERSLRAPNQSATLPPGLADAPPLTAFAYHEAGQGYYRLTIPSRLVRALAELPNADPTGR